MRTFLSSFSCLPKLLLLLKLLISALISNRRQLRAFDCSPKSAFFFLNRKMKKPFSLSLSSFQVITKSVVLRFLFSLPQKAQFPFPAFDH